MGQQTLKNTHEEDQHHTGWSNSSSTATLAGVSLRAACVEVSRGAACGQQHSSLTTSLRGLFHCFVSSALDDDGMMRSDPRAMPLLSCGGLPLACHHHQRQDRASWMMMIHMPVTELSCAAAVSHPPSSTTLSGQQLLRAGPLKAHPSPPPGTRQITDPQLLLLVWSCARWKSNHFPFSLPFLVLS